LLCCLQIVLIALQAEKGQVAFGTSVCEVSLFTALVADDILEVAILFDGRGSARDLGWPTLAPLSSGSGGGCRSCRVCHRTRHMRSSEIAPHKLTTLCVPVVYFYLSHPTVHGGVCQMLFLEVRRHLLTHRHLVTDFSTVMTSNYHLLGQPGVLLWWSRYLEPWVCVLAVRSIRAKSGQVV